MDIENGTTTTATTTVTTTATTATTTTATIVKAKYYHGIKDGSWFTQFCYGCNPWMARYAYGLIFLITNFLAWVVRDYGKGAMKEMARLKECKGGADCLGTAGVLRVSMGCFMFFFAMFLSTVGISKVYDRRDTWHSGWWSMKATMFLGFMVLPFLFPTTFIEMYGEIAHFGAGIFLLIQLVSVISFITWLNDCCLSEKYAERCVMQSNPCDNNRDKCICCEHRGISIDVLLVRTGSFMSPKHFLHHLDSRTSPTYDECFSPTKN